MSTEDRTQAIFGAFDGVCSLMGLVLYLALEGSLHTAIGGAFAGAVGAAASMSSGEYLSDHTERLRPAAAMGAATLIASLLPVTPLLFGADSSTLLASVVVALGVCGVVAYVRPEGLWPSVVKTYGAFVFCVVLALGVSLLAGGLS